MCLTLSRKGQGQQRFLFYFVGLGTAGGGAGAGAALYREHMTIASDALETREHVEKRSHVGGLFLHPDNVARVAVTCELGGEFFFWKRVELFEKDNRGRIVFSFFALCLEFVADLAGADQDAVGLSDLYVGNYVLEILLGEVGDGR